MTTPGCEEIRLELPMYARSGRSAETGSLMARHVRECAGCREELMELQRLDTLLDAHLPSMIPSTTFASSFANRLAAQVLAEGDAGSGSGIGAWFRPWLIPLGVGAALAVMVVHQVVTVDRGPAPVARGPEAAAEAPEEAGTGESVRVAQSKEPAVPAQDDAPAGEEGGKWLSAPPPEVLERLDLFVDYAVIEELDRLEATERAG